MISLAYAMGGAPAGGQAGSGMGGTFFLIVSFGLIFYFLILRPQQKKQKEQQTMLNNLAHGDMVRTTGGIHGKITGLTDTVITLEIADKVRIKIDRSHIGDILQKSGAAVPTTPTKS